MARYHRVRYLPDKGGKLRIALILDTADPSPGTGLQIIPEAEHHGNRHLTGVAGDRRCLFFRSADRAVIDIPAQIEYDDDLVGFRRGGTMPGYETDGNVPDLVLHQGADSVPEITGSCGKRIAVDNRDDRPFGGSRIEIALMKIRWNAWIILDDYSIARG